MWEQRFFEDNRHPLFNRVSAAVYRLASRESFQKNVEPLSTSTSESMSFTMWEERFSDLSPVSPMGLKPCEELPAGTESMWMEWKCLKRLRTAIGSSKVLLHKLGYLKDTQDLILNCDCGTEPHTMQHLLQCPLLEQVYAQ